MSNNLKAVFFDADGVLIDSLENHLKFCRSEAEKLDLDIRIPDSDEFRSLVLTGKKVSPMSEFFRAVGFPEDKIERAVDDYRSEFSKFGVPKVFDGVRTIIQSLRGSEIKLGLITSNVKENIESVLGDTMHVFDPACVFYLREGQTKAEQLIAGARALELVATQCVFVGDQPADQLAAKDAGVRFVGVTYGWGFRPNGEQPFETADNAFAIPLAAQRAVFEGSSSLQFDYAWKWFNYHADQRIKMFNYMFLGLGLFATAIAGTLDKHLPAQVTAALCIFAGVLALIFTLIDIRNHYLLRLSEEILTDLEKHTIFGRDRYLVDRLGNTIHFGILWRQNLEHQKHECWIVEFVLNACRGKHRVWLRAVSILLAILFITAGLLIFRYEIPITGEPIWPKVSFTG